MFKAVLTLMFLLNFFFVSSAFAENYKIDADHSTVSFTIRHLFSNVQGSFRKFDGKFVYDAEKPETWQVEASIDASSIDTNVPERDKHLRSADFFDVEKYPKITFKSTNVTNVSKESAKVEGLLNLHGVEKPVTLDLQIHGVGKDPWGNTRAGFTATTTLNRKDFGLNWNKALETGGVLVGDEVKITLEVEGLLDDTGQAEEKKEETNEKQSQS
jgi:polyisoprenoid-binding protein YceI